MTVELKNCNTMVVTGDVKNLDCYTEIKKAIQSCLDAGEKNITVEILDSIMITSSIIGYFTKLIHADGVKLNIVVQSERLYSLLTDLNLVKMFNVTMKK